eukprot:SAG31_NODE_31329_length_369_cov_1.033333_1_plen_26_part_10
MPLLPAAMHRRELSTAGHPGRLRIAQ